MGVYIKSITVDEFKKMCRLNIKIWNNLVEVPEPHGRLIDADALADDLEYDASHYEEDHEMKLNCASWLRSNATPTVIEAEGE